MNEMIRIAETVLGLDFPDRRDTGMGRDLHDCLVRLCPPAGDDPASQESRHLYYLDLRGAVLGRMAMLDDPFSPTSDQVVPEQDLQAALRETRREIGRWCRVALFWSQAGVIPHFDRASRTLHVDGKPVYTWSGHAPESGPQLTVLAAFQEEEWRRAIDCPLDPAAVPNDTCRKLNARVGEFIRFGVAGDSIRWSDPGK